MIMKSVENYLMFESFQWLKNLAICIILTVFGRSTKVPTRCIFFNTHDPFPIRQRIGGCDVVA